MTTKASEAQKLLVYYALLTRNHHRAAALFAEGTNFQPKPDDVSRLRDLLSMPCVQRWGPGIVLRDNQLSIPTDPNNPPAPEISFQDSCSDSDLGSSASSNSPSHEVSSCSSSLFSLSNL